LIESGRKVVVIAEDDVLGPGWEREDVGVITETPHSRFNPTDWYEIAPVTGKGQDTILLTEEEFRALDSGI